MLTDMVITCLQCALINLYGTGTRSILHTTVHSEYSLLLEHWQAAYSVVSCGQFSEAGKHAYTIKLHKHSIALHQGLFRLCNKAASGCGPTSPCSGRASRPEIGAILQRDLVPTALPISTARR